MYLKHCLPGLGENLPAVEHRSTAILRARAPLGKQIHLWHVFYEAMRGSQEET